jgi:hypothetical protein
LSFRESTLGCRAALCAFALACLTGLSGAAQAEVFVRTGYHYQFLSLSSSYNKFLKDRYGLKSLALSGLAYSVHYRSRGKSFALGLEMDNLKGGIKYNTLNSEKQENALQLNQTLLLLSYYPSGPRLIVDFGYGSNTLVRSFYGYQDAKLVTTNIDNSVGQKEISTSGSVMMAQVLYHTFGKRIGVDFGARYSLSQHVILWSDARPSYDSKGLPTSTYFNVGGLTLLGTLTFNF